MSIKRLRLVCTCLAMAVVLLATGCRSASSSSNSASEKTTTPVVSEGLKKSGTLCVGIRSSATTPFVLQSDGALSGLDVDLAYSLANELGLKIELVQVDDVASALTDSCDLVMGVSNSEVNDLAIVGDYAESAYALFHSGDAGVLPESDLTGKTVALQEESPSQIALRLTPLNMSETIVDSLNEAFDALEEQEVEFVACQAASGAYLSSWRDNISFAGCYSIPEARGVALQSGDGAVQKAVREAYERLQNNGLLDEIRRTWLGDLPVLTSDSIIPNTVTKTQDVDSATSSAPASSGEEVLSNAMDGSTAGKNAVTLAELRASGATVSEVGVEE